MYMVYIFSGLLHFNLMTGLSKALAIRYRGVVAELGSRTITKKAKTEPMTLRAQKRAFKLERFRSRVEERRNRGEDVVEYALANPKVSRYLTEDERERLKHRVFLRNLKREAREKAELEAKDRGFRAYKNTLREGGSEQEAEAAYVEAYRDRVVRRLILVPSRSSTTATDN